MGRELPKVCIIGAGSSGIVACKVFKEYGIPYDCFDTSDRIGGNWVFKNKNGMSSAYRSLHINTSRDKMAYSDFPLPQDYPDFPNHFQIAEYFENYVDHFGFRSTIELNKSVSKVEQLEDKTWRVEIESTDEANTPTSETRCYDVVVVANGHHWDPQYPDPKFPGEFNGEQLHSHHYIDVTDPIDFKGKNVVIVGMGNSAMDIACELGRQGVAGNCYLSVRRGTHIVPKYFGSEPLDAIMRHPAEEPSVGEHLLNKLPYGLVQGMIRPLFERKVRNLVGQPQDYGLPKPKHKFGQTHPTISDEIHIRLGSGDVKPKPNIKQLMGDKVMFTDGSVEEVDVIIYATGYKITFPFLDQSYVSTQDNDVALYERIVDPDHPSLLFLALVQPLCAMMPIAEAQAKWMASYLTGQYHLPTTNEMKQALAEEHETMKARYVDSKRHTIQIDCQKYTYYLAQDLKAGQERAVLAGNFLPIASKASNQGLDEANAPKQTTA